MGPYATLLGCLYHGLGRLDPYLRTSSRPQPAPESWSNQLLDAGREEESFFLTSFLGLLVRALISWPSVDPSLGWLTVGTSIPFRGNPTPTHGGVVWRIIVWHKHIPLSSGYLVLNNTTCGISTALATFLAVSSHQSSETWLSKLILGYLVV